LVRFFFTSFAFHPLLDSVGDNSKFTVESGKYKLTYAEIVSASTAAETQNKIIAASEQAVKTQ
jgi:hypothetical protein